MSSTERILSESNASSAKCQGEKVRYWAKSKVIIAFTEDIGSHAASLAHYRSEGCLTLDGTNSRDLFLVPFMNTKVTPITSTWRCGSSGFNRTRNTTSL
jgi:hypothetical protein